MVETQFWPLVLFSRGVLACLTREKMVRHPPREIEIETRKVFRNVKLGQAIGPTQRSVSSDGSTAFMLAKE